MLSYIFCSGFYVFFLFEVDAGDVVEYQGEAHLVTQKLNIHKIKIKKPKTDDEFVVNIKQVSLRVIQ